MNINSESSTYTNAAYSSKGFSGMASGIDTESLVQSMLSSMQSKIDKQNQSKQVLEWKQEIYRNIISDINDFQNKYFNLTSNTSLRLNSFFNTMQTSCSSSAVSVSSNNASSASEFQMQVARLASATSAESSANAGNIEVSDATKANSFEFSREVNIKIGDDDAFTVNLKKEDGTELTADEIADMINDAFHDNGGNSKINLVEVNRTYKDADGNEYTKNSSGNYVDKDGNEVTDQTKVDGIKEEILGLSFNANESFQISGSAAGMATLGFSGTVKSTPEKDEDGDVIENSFEIKSNAVNTQFSKKGAVNGTVDVTLDGVKKTISIAEGGSMEDFQKKVQAAFGNSIKFDKDEDGNWSISVDGKGRNLTMSANSDTMKAMGFSKSTVSNRILRSDSIKNLGITNETDENGEVIPKTFTINGKEISYTEKDTVSSIMNKINSSGAGVKLSFDDLSGKFKMQATSTGKGFDIKLEGDDEGLFSKLGFNMSATGELQNVKEGQNAIVNINGVTVERANNNFSYNGLSITLKSTTGKYQTDSNGDFIEDGGKLQVVDGTVDGAAEIKTTRNTDKLVDTLKSFVEDYNTLIEKLNKYTHEEASYKKYPPLTDAQKKEMSEKEIELWEEKAKEGLLRNDRDISDFLSSMRTAMYTKSGARLAISNIGIDSSNNWRDYGKLSIDEDKLRAALESDAEGVMEIFTGENGLASRLNKICDKTANTSSGRPGTLVTLAGVVGKGTENDNTIKDRLDSISKKIETLNRLYEKKKERYWKQFNAMEKALSNMNSQSSWLSSMLGY